ncbi:MAG TPA: hypothetical protein VNA21_14340 [Steroidobacteraceae bacterium]|nr:hypothetical protein [Steroidobacteraceae bacterium]
MVCDHLAALETALIEAAVPVTFRGAPWSNNCREWVYFSAQLDTASLQERFKFADCVSIHINTDSKSGRERGFECTQCHDAVMGLFEGGALFK